MIPLISLLAAWPLAGDPAVLVKPYVQPGPGSTLVGRDAKLVCWLTDQTPGDFAVEYRVPGRPPRFAAPRRQALDFAIPPPPPPKSPAKNVVAAVANAAVETVKKAIPALPERAQRYFQYAAALEDLPFDAEVPYRVTLNGATVRAAAFRTRASADRPVRFCLVGDLANGLSAQKAIAHRMALEKPEFVVALGDIVYPSGRVLQYMGYYWGTYCNAEAAGPKTGAPLMASAPFYALLGNHDVAAKLPAIPDALGAYYFFHAPRNGPPEGPWCTPLGADAAAAAKFRAAVGANYPALAFYSFDNGPVHGVVIDCNRAANMDEPALRRWLEDDLKAATAPWKIACFHMPAFHSSRQHYTEQQMRRWQPLLEAGGVDLAFAGHVHNYQRTRPLKFVPAAEPADKRGRINGRFSIDVDFDGVTDRLPDGVIHVVAGGGGAPLYGPGLEKTSVQLRKDHGDNYADYTARFDAGRHSFALVEATPERLLLRALGPEGEEIDRIAIDNPSAGNKTETAR